MFRLSAIQWRRVVTIALGVLAGLVATAGTSAVAVAGFTLSYDAIRKVGIASGVRPTWAWLLPVSIDGAMAVGTVTATVMSRMGRNVWYPWLVVLAGAGISIACNAVHAKMREHIALDDRTAMAVSAIPAVMLALSIHLLVVLVDAAALTVEGHNGKADAPGKAAATASATPPATAGATATATGSATSAVAAATRSTTRAATRSTTNRLDRNKTATKRVAKATTGPTTAVAAIAVAPATGHAAPSVGAPVAPVATPPVAPPVAAPAAVGVVPADALATEGATPPATAGATDDRNDPLYAIIRPLVAAATDAPPSQQSVYNAIKEQTGRGAGFPKIAKLIDLAQREVQHAAATPADEAPTNGHAKPEYLSN